jgi:putative FmdB family regulatory protein
MPAYDYKCTACDERFEITRSSSDATEIRCPSCDGPTKRVFTPVGVHFKGSGFYNTDHKGKGPGSAKPASDPKPAADSAPAPCAAATDGGACASCPAAADS